MERLTTGRLLLRAFEAEDLQSLYAYCSEPDTGIHADKKPHESIEESRQLLNPVSYTHLDVYKRQAPGSGFYPSCGGGPPAATPLRYFFR